MPDTTPTITTDLSGTWTLSSLDAAHALTMPVPGDVHSALLSAGVIPDPYVGRNEADVQWVAEQDWVLERTFDLDDTALSDRWYLDLAGLDTVVDVFLNDALVLEADNSFRRYRPDVTGKLVSGTNRLKLVIKSSVRESAERQARQPFYIPYSTANSPIPNGSMLRKVQCHFGWDWNIAIAPLGVYEPPLLKRLVAARIEHVTTRQDWHADGSVDLVVSAALFAAEAGHASIAFDLDGVVGTIDVDVSKGITTVEHVFPVRQPNLWWPAGSGAQALSRLVVSVGGDRVRKTIGFRRIELLTDPDEAGSRFAFRVNGVEIFCRGANWIPADALFSRVTEAGVEDLLQSAVGAHMNMIRVWGGGFYEPDWFYDLCDRLGLMVWQDFMFACNLYPSTQDFLDNVAAEVDDQVRRLSSHPSIALWCGDNELVGALTWFEESRRDRDRYLVSYDRLNRTIETTMKKAAPDLIWWPSSPAVGPLNFGDAWHADGAGDMHYWSVWHENKSFDNYRTVRPRFCSEFGFQSYTSMPVIHDFAAARDLNIASPVMESHQKNAGGNERIAGTMFRYFRFPKDFASFVYLSQIQQGLAIKTAVEFWRSLKPHCMGTLYWQLNDTWPVASWSSLDYGGSWKAMHYMVRRFFQPVAVAAIPSDDGKTLSLSMVNDTRAPVSIEVQTFLVTLAGERRPLVAASGTCPADRAATLVELPAADIPEGMLLFWTFEASDGARGEGHHVPGTYKALDLEPSGLTIATSAVAGDAAGGIDVTVSATGLALHVMVEAGVSGRFSDNAFDLTAGTSRTVRFTPSTPGEGPTPVFTAYDLQSSAG